MSEEYFNEVIFPISLIVCCIIAAGGFIWERSRHRFNSMDTAVHNLVSGLQHDTADSGKYVLVPWRKLFPMSKDMASEYAKECGFEYIGTHRPTGSPTPHLKFRLADNESANEERLQ